MRGVTLLAQASGSEPAGGAAAAEAIGATVGASRRDRAHSCRDRGPPQRAHRLAPAAVAPGRAPVRPAGVGRAAVGRHGGVAADRGARDVLGHLAPHRQRARRRPARQPGPLPDPDRPVRRAARGCAVDGAVRPRATLPYGRPHRRRLVGAGRRADDRRLRRLRADGLPSRRPLAPHLRPGRDALGPDPPDADRRRLARGARRHGADGGGDHDDRTRPGARESPLVRLPPAPCAARRRLPRRALDVPGRVRLRSPAVPARPAPDPDHAGRGPSASSRPASISAAAARSWRRSASSPSAA